MGAINEVSRIRRRLKRAWLPFFGRFGTLTPVQIKTIPRILDGANVMLASPTASGKTEAVLAPIAEKLPPESVDGIALVYLVPTRALANDILARAQGPLGEMGIRASLKHGDKPHLARDRPPACLITTPESLDSLICRWGHAFADLRAIILDEIHLLDNTYRGDQVRLLLRRLRSLARAGRFAVHALSATLAQPTQVGLRYMAEFDVLEVRGVRRVDYHIVTSVERAYRVCRANGWKKVLCFCNLRESVERVASELAKLWSPYPVVAHHGSLDRRVREEAEEVMRSADVAVCVSTSTLEVGIDIGNIDVILLAEPPWSLSALLQRVGRGNRRESRTNAVAIAGSETEASLLRSMFEAASSGILPTEPYRPDLSVVVQQILSCAYQHAAGVHETSILHLVSCLCGDKEAKIILDHLRERDWIEKRGGRWFASSKLMDLGEKGRIHSNIPDSQSYTVIEKDTGEKIGRVAGVVDEVFVLARRAWRVLSVTANTILVCRFTGKAGMPVFKRQRNVGAFYHLLPEQLKTQG